MTNEQVAFAFIRELQKRFGKTAVLSDIEMSQEQGWTHAVVDVCDAYRAAHEPGDNARLNAAIESAHLTKTQRRLFEESWNGTAENRPAEPT
jgi:hypothetical protein